MFGPERQKSQLSQEESGRVNKMARSVASRGEDAVQMVKETKGQLYVQAISMLEKRAYREGVLEDVKIIRHTIDTLEAVQEKAEEIMRQEGTDDLSKLEKIRRRILFGSAKK